MNFKDKLKKSRQKAIIATIVASIASIYFLMTFIKGVEIWTYGSAYPFPASLNNGANWLIDTTFFFPMNFAWETIPALPLDGRSSLLFFKVIIPPAVVLTICGFFINDHRLLKNKFKERKAKIEEELALKEMRKEAGIETVAENPTVDVVISNATNTDPSWHNTWWGKIAIGLAIILIATAIGIG